MPELPEVEVVGRGLRRWVAGRRVASVEVLHPRAIRRHRSGAGDFAARLTDRRLGAARRRGKYLWLPAGEPADEALVAHLGMSGQLLVGEADLPPQRHLRVRFTFHDHGPDLRFVDQRTFGGLLVEPLVAGTDVPPVIAHIAPDPLDDAFDTARFVAAVRRRDSEIKRALLDQSLVSGIGNIYADEALWRARLHGRRATARLRVAEVRALVAEVREVLGQAIAAGGTTFDTLYVNVNGDSGYFDRSLHVYGRSGQPCPRCGTPIVREAFMNRSSYFCPRCQIAPRRRAAPAPAARAGRPHG